MKQKLVGVVMFLMVGLGSTFAQQGFLKGKITDKKTGEELVGAAIVVDGTTMGAITDFNGDYNMPPLQAGIYNIRVQYISYDAQVLEGIVVQGGEETTLNIQLLSATMDIQEVQVKARANRESETMLLMDQKKASVAIESIGAKELSNKGVSDAAAAVTKVTGITKQEDTGILNVRGLGDRYNTTTLNLLPLPSDNPEVKNINLELFSTDVISHIQIQKNYSSALYGDFGGANININSKRLTGDSFFNVSTQVAYNSSLSDIDEFKRVDGPNNTGFYNQQVPADIDAIVNQEAYGFTNSWDAESKGLLPDFGLGISGGTKREIGKGELSGFFTLSFDEEKSYTNRLERIVSATGVALTDVEGEEYKYETQTSGMLNLNYSLPKSELYFNTMLLNSSEESIISLSGNLRDVGENAFRRRSEFDRNMIWVNQLLGEHTLANGFSLAWGVAYNYVWNTVPDRRQAQYMTYDSETNIGEFDTEAAGANYRYYREFTDDEYAINWAVHKKMNVDADGSYKHKVELGYSGKFKNRYFINYTFNHDIDDGVDVNVDEVDSYLNEENYLADEFQIAISDPRDENGDEQYGEDYEGSVKVNSAFLLWEWNIAEKLLLVAGVRAESVNQEITTRSNQITGIGTNVETFNFDVFKTLPSLSLRYKLNEQQNLRFAASQTYTLPQLQEMPFMSFSGITDVIYGNPYLTPSDIYNVDLKWEYFPKGGLLSAAVFYKRIIDPINKTTLAGTQSSYFVANTGAWAYVYGFELDAKKDLYKTESSKVSAAGNISILESEMELDGDKIKEETEYNFNANFNNDRSELQGAAPILANLSIGYSQKLSESNTCAVVGVYNYTSDRLYAIGQTSRGDEYDKARNTLDLVLKSTFGKFEFDLKAKNLLNAEFKRVQENRVEEVADYDIRKYKKGIGYSFSVKYKL